MREPTNEGQPVEVWNGFTRSWAAGFRVAETLEHDRVRVRRSSDDVVLPGDVPASSVRPERRPDD